MLGRIWGGKKRRTAEYTTTSCEKCGAVQKRRFRAGDYVFREITGKDGACAACGGGAVTVRSIFSEDEE